MADNDTTDVNAEPEFVTRDELAAHMESCEELTKQTANEMVELRGLFDGLLNGMPAKDGKPALMGYRQLSEVVSTGITSFKWVRRILGAICLSIIGAFAFYVIETKILEDIEEDEAATLHAILDELKKQQGTPQ